MFKASNIHYRCFASSQAAARSARTATEWWRYIVSAASNPTVASHAGADRPCGRNRSFVHEVSMTNNCSSSLMSHSVKLSVFSSERVKPRSVGEMDLRYEADGAIDPVGGCLQD